MAWNNFECWNNLKALLFALTVSSRIFFFRFPVSFWEHIQNRASEEDDLSERLKKLTTGKSPETAKQEEQN